MPSAELWAHANRRDFLSAIAGLAAMGLTGCGGGGSSDGGAAPPVSRPVGTWSGVLSDLQEDVGFLRIPPPASTFFKDQTLRQVAHLSVGGDQIRIKFGNVYGKEPLRLERVRVALGTGAGAVDVATDVAVTFQGQVSAVVPAGGELWSDQVAIHVPDGGNLAVSVYVREAADSTSAHRYPNAIQYLAPGDWSNAAAMPVAAANQLTSTYWMDAIDVYKTMPTRVVVAFGDSITDGNGSTVDANRRYPDLLSARLRPSGGAVSVVNAGLAGNRWLHNRFGLKGVERFQRDVLSVSGVTHAIVQMGINDIGFQQAWTPDEKATPAQIIASIAGAVAAGKAAGIQMYLATLTPFKGHEYFSVQGEQMRQEANAWIRANKDVAGVFDFDAAVRDPADPERIDALYRDADQLHLNDLGYARMVESIPLGAFG